MYMSKTYIYTSVYTTSVYFIVKIIKSLLKELGYKLECTKDKGKRNALLHFNISMNIRV